MNKPYIIVHMMTSIDGRIDCGMTAQLPGNNVYYSTLSAIDAPTRVTGRTTAASELTSGRKFNSTTSTAIGKPDFAKNSDADSYNIVVDTKGTLLWGNDKNASQPHLIITSELASQEYLDYLNNQGISWIAAGKEHTDLKKAMQILADEFGVKRLAIVGGGHINGGFLKAGLVDEISVVVGPGVDGRSDQPSLFEGLANNEMPVIVKLKNVQSYDDGTVWLRYLTK